MSIELKKQIRFLDLALTAAQKRQSQTTGFVHIEDTIPIYENACFAMALFKQKRAESILEAKELISRLIEFQSKDGNFPIYLHEFPICRDIKMGLKVAPIFSRILQQFESVLGYEFSQKIKKSLEKIFHFYSDKQLKPLWDFRLKVLKKESPPTLNTSHFTAIEMWEYWVALQFIQTPLCDFYDIDLQIALRFYQYQDGFEPASNLIDWSAAGTIGEYSTRLLKDHPLQIQLAALDAVGVIPYNSKSKWIWKEGPILHSLYIGDVVKEMAEGTYIVELNHEFKSERDDQFEYALFCDRSSDIKILVDGKSATTFSFQQTILISSPSRTISIVFSLIEGEGDFYGHIFPSNRPFQIATKENLQYEAFDWKIGLRTLRRSTFCKLQLQLRIL